MTEDPTPVTREVVLDVLLPALLPVQCVEVRRVHTDAGAGGAEFLAYFPLSPGQQPEITFPDS